MASEKITAIVESVKTMTVLKLKEQASKADAEEMKKKLEEVGAKVELK